MLVLTRKLMEKLFIGDDICVTVVRLEGGQVRLGIVQPHIDENTELYTVRDVIWARAGMEPWGGCLCIGCLEKRLGRKLKPKDFLRGHELNTMPGSPRLMKRRK